MARRRRENDESKQPPQPSISSIAGEKETPLDRREAEVGSIERVAGENVLQSMSDQMTLLNMKVDLLAKSKDSIQPKRDLDLVPVHISELMMGFQAAVSRANKATKAVEDNTENLAVKNLEVSITAPIIDDEHADNPIIMLPNMNSVDEESSKVTLKFSVVSVPVKLRG